MILKSADIINFKNIRQASLEFSPRVNCLLGDNGMGKSNLLEAIHFLCFTRPMTSIPESSLILHGSDMLMTKGIFLPDHGGEVSISCGIVRGKGKTLRHDGKEYERLSQHIGRFPLVTVTPQDSEIVSGSAEMRRRMADMVISQANPVYLSQLMRYNRALESRNRMLRAGVKDKILYESVEASITEAAAEIHSVRKAWTEEMAPVVARYYSRIAGCDETASLTYSSVLNERTMQEVLLERRAKDAVLGYTSAGIHRDDFLTGLGDYSMRRLGSQGQVKTFTIALRFAIFDYLRKASGLVPILLLDDIFDKLDASRVERIMHEVSGPGSFSQIFITDTNRRHLDDILAAIDGPRLMLGVEKGNFSPITEV